jgi:hypothetical protein
VSRGERASGWAAGELTRVALSTPVAQLVLCKEKASSKQAEDAGFDACTHTSSCKATEASFEGNWRNLKRG